VVGEIIYGDGFWHINRRPLSFAMQCSTLQKNTSAKCMGKINTQKTTFGTPIPSYSSFSGFSSTISIILFK